ncbi:bile acid:sodium symporter family protein [Pelagicoccus mobilis]|uniref:Bile acid:sodium symporter family protein n=1 Tax=Pelagicoccus mobilis TaxID=415221 RepID=A0A934RWH1_9BACT|nr:bile acid:sodium symporter family protein [Pelagicoccus mobilis]MBK1879025.1 bile acid:sodium symporter family protein [Pelagicoccus mobilis]
MIVASSKTTSEIMKIVPLRIAAPVVTLLLFLVFASVVISTVFVFLKQYQPAGLMGVAAMLLAAFYFQLKVHLKTFSFTCLVFAFFLASLVYPEAFLVVGGFDQRSLILPLIQIIMFGMGATLSLRDFSNALRMPKAVLIGIGLQFAIMPMVGWSVAYSMGFDPEIAAGIILIGSCPGGVASNVMAYLAKGNVALSVSMTACSTLLSPLLTPLVMSLFAGRLIDIDFLGMMFSILNLIILPIGAGLLAHYLLQSKWKSGYWRAIVFAFAVGFYFAAPFIESWTKTLYSLSGAFVLMGVLRQQWLSRGLPVVSMLSICYIVAIIAAGSQEAILTVGVGLFIAAIIHNSIGYVAGYWGARIGNLSESECRTVALEVGMQNGGMGSALALNVLQSTSSALGSIIFGTWMNLSGSVLASWWKGRPTSDIVCSENETTSQLTRVG